MTIQEYEASIPENWSDAYTKLKEIFLDYLPAGFELTMQYGMPTFVVPLSTFPQGYLKRKDEPLPFVSIGVWRHHLAVYHMGLVVNKPLLVWFKDHYPAKLNMGKSCIRFTKPNLIPYELMIELAQKMTVADWVATYTQASEKKDRLSK